MTCADSIVLRWDNGKAMKRIPVTVAKAKVVVLYTVSGNAAYSAFTANAQIE